MTKLRLGPIEDDKPVKLTIELPGSLHRDLTRYGAVHGQENNRAQPLAPEKLIPAMIERFMASDRGFNSKRAGDAAG